MPTAAVAGPLYARFIVGRVMAEAPPAPDRTRSLEPGRSLPGFGVTVFTLMLPVLLMLVATAGELLYPPGNHVRETLSFVGNPTIALVAAVLLGDGRWDCGAGIRRRRCCASRRGRWRPLA